MTTFYTLGARLSGMAAVVCAVLALLAYPEQARADPGINCYQQCGSYTNDCYKQCMSVNGCSGGDCDNGCGTQPISNCSPGACNASGKGFCTDCTCKDFSAENRCTCAF